MIDEAMKNQRCCHCRFYHEEDDKTVLSKLWRRKAILENDRCESSAVALVVSTGSAGSNKKKHRTELFEKKVAVAVIKATIRYLPDNFGKIDTSRAKENDTDQEGRNR